MRFEYKPIKYNHSSRNGHTIQYIVIHDTGNPSPGAGAENHYRYFSGGNRGASAHYFVDDKGIIQIIGDSKSAWAVGDNQGYGRYLNGARNQNSISIELCINPDSDYDTAFDLTLDLTRTLMRRYGIPHSRVVRHYDVSRKNCPGTMRANYWAKWHEFKRRLREDAPKYQIDTRRSSPIVELQGGKSMTEQEIRKIIREELKPSTVKGGSPNAHWAYKHYAEANAVIDELMIERRFDDYITRGEVIKLISMVIAHYENK